MKSEHRHQLEANALAQRLEVAIERFRPYASTIAGVIVAIVVVMFIWSYVAGSSSARHSEAWDAYNQAIAEPVPNVDDLRLAAEEHPGTKMQQMADVTYADSQVWVAARDFIYNRKAAMEALDRATSRYRGVLESSEDERLTTRAHLGLARVYEIRGELEKAREEYLKVKGGYAQYAAAQAARLANPEAREIYNWLATAEPPRPRAPLGPGTPGRRPEFSEGELDLPQSSAAPGVPTTSPGQEESFENLLEGLQLDFGDTTQGESNAPAGTPAPSEPSSPADESEAPAATGSDPGKTQTQP